MKLEHHLMDCYHLLLLYFILSGRKQNLPNVVIRFEENEKDFPTILGERDEQRLF